MNLRGLLVIVALLSIRSVQATPQVMRVDGAVYDSAGSPYTGSRDIQIKAYDAASGGTLLWTSAVYTSTVTNGRFTVNLDTTSSSPNLAGVLSSASVQGGVYFEIIYDGVSVKPRMRAHGTLLAVSAGTADALRNVSVSTAVPTSGQVLSFDGTKWAPATAGGSDATKLATAGDTMTGALGLNYAGATPGRFLYVDASRAVTSSSYAVSDSDFATLLGLTTALAPFLNSLTGNVQIQLSAKESTLSKGALSANGGGLSVSGGANAVIGAGAALSIATASASVSGVVTASDWNTFNAKQAALGFTPVNKAGDTMSGALQVSGSLTSSAGQIFADQNLILSGATVDFNTGNVQVLQAPGQAAITLNNMKDGASYTVIVASDTSPRQYTFTNCTNSWFAPPNAVVSGKALYTIIKVTVSSATHCYISWLTGF